MLGQVGRTRPTAIQHGVVQLRFNLDVAHLPEAIELKLGIQFARYDELTVTHTEPRGVAIRYPARHQSCDRSCSTAEGAR
jgi:hypothetical protein